MAQLIKLHDYVSRYQQDIFVYPSRYVRLKQKQWQGLKMAWENEPPSGNENVLSGMNQAGQKKQDFLQKMKKVFIKRKELEQEMEDPGKKESEDEELEVSEIPSNIQTEKELKQYYLDCLLPFQLKWASSTLMERSFPDQSFFRDGNLRYFLQRFPDTFLVMYKPVFLLRNAPVEGESILITPTAAWCITFLEDETDAVYIGSKEHFWNKKTGDQEVKLLNPLLALDRTEKIVQHLFNDFDIDMPVFKAILSRNGYIDYSFPPYGIQFIDKRNYPEWFQSMRGLSSPLKHVQLKGAQALLAHCLTTSVRRAEWRTDG
ncbi:NERD domain-containing protein [Mesobacillus foraminis]|uniref:NERD domain-containing protein n=1 Tax=Mesobacillus foraminis TaxID=279826 RepID=UPI00399FD721